MILLVEDDRDEVDVALRAITRSGISAAIKVAGDGQSALALLGIEPDPAVPIPLHPRLVLLDLKLPRVDGWEVLRRLRETPETSTVPVVVVSASDDAEDIRRAYALGANSYLVKHFDPRNPGRYFAEAARYWLELNRPAPS